MSEYTEIESKISGLLPKTKARTCENLDEIVRLTGLMATTTKDRYYTHSVCHLFEGYGNPRLDNRGSYLYCEGLFEAAEKVANAALMEAVKSRNFDCVTRIVYPIITYNLNNMVEGQKGFAFKPNALSDPKFIEAYKEYIDQWDKDDEFNKNLKAYQIEFCEAEEMGKFYSESLRKMQEAYGASPSKPDSAKEVSGIYVDVDDTLLTKYPDKLNNKLQTYLVRQMDDGKQVTVFTSGDPKKASEALRRFGADSRLLDVKSKSEYLGKTLEVCIDDTIPAWQGFTAKVYMHPENVQPKYVPREPVHVDKPLEITVENIPQIKQGYITKCIDYVKNKLRL